MPKSGFYDIVKVNNNRVSITQTSHFSIGTSPYYAHQHGLAIDIYQNLTLENYDVLSPISGKVLQIKTLAAPKPRFIDGVNVDYLILINNGNKSESVWKIMHVKPIVNVGEFINVGDVLGKTIRNGYFAYWSSPHLHLELRPSNDAIRARGGKDFSLAIENENIVKQISKQENANEIPIEISSICPEIILGKLPKHFYHYLYPFYGFKVRINNIICILDGGIPHYKIGTVISNQRFSSDKRYTVYFGFHEIGNLHEIKGQLGFLKFNNVKFLLNDIEIRGISLYLANFYPQVKIIPYKKNQFSFKPKSIQYLRLVSEESLE
ncbi:MAG: M23 family metallopeptidase [Promethearchaeota archaeon]